jgi:RNA ligase (TIGR02306 family)
MSKLVVEVCKVEEVTKHPNADRLSIVKVKGWYCVTGLNDYAVDDLVVYCPPDSVIPQHLIEKYNLEYLKKNGRVGTVKLRKCISQGLILPLPDSDSKRKFAVGDDLAVELGITKYEPPAPKYQQNLQGKKSTRKKRNPLFDKYTNIENIKNYNRIFKEGDEVVITEKIHGTNFRAGRLPINPGYSFLDKIQYWWYKYILKRGYEFVYGSHNVQITYHANRNCFYGEDVYGRMAEKYKLAEIIPEDFIVYGEIYGKGIQELEYDRADIDVVFFDIKYKNKYLSYTDFVKFCSKYDLPKAPALYIGPFSEQVLKEETNGKSTIAKHIREGCVVKSFHEENHPVVGRKVLKSISEEYLANKKRTEYK